MDEYWRSKTIQLMRIPQTHPKNVKSAFRLFFEETVYKRFFFRWNQLESLSRARSAVASWMCQAVRTSEVRKSQHFPWFLVDVVLVNSCSGFHVLYDQVLYK